MQPPLQIKARQCLRIQSTKIAPMMSSTTKLKAPKDEQGGVNAQAALAGC
jgi:hypothetical protein